MFHLSRRCTAMVAATAIGILIAACSSSSSSSVGGPPVTVPPTSFSSSPASVVPSAGRQLHSVRMEDDYKVLDRGILIYTPLPSLYSDESIELNVTVIDVGRAPQVTSIPTMYNGQAIDPYDVPTSADVVVQITCSGNVTCQNLTSPNQYRQLVSPQYEGHWAWGLAAQNPGTALIRIKAFTYKKGSNALLYKTPILSISLNVSATPT